MPDLFIDLLKAFPAWRTLTALGCDCRLQETPCLEEEAEAAGIHQCE